MKKSFIVPFLLISNFVNSQIVVQGVSPSSIAGTSYSFEWVQPGGSWSVSIPDFNTPGVFIQDTLELVVDNSWTGNNTAYTIPHPLANEGCLDANGGAHSQPSLTGKIAVVWRGNCQFSTKAALAENNGAVGIIIINHSGAPVSMSGGDSGLYVNIPVIMISTTDGQLLLSEMANGPVEVFIGNKLGSYNNDIGSSKELANISKYGSVPKVFVENGMNNFDLGLTITNFGSNDNSPILTQSITGPSGYSNTNTISYGVLSAYQDTNYSYVPFTDSNLLIGEYTLNYDLSISNQTDESMVDNNVASSFSVTNNVLSRARTDQNTGEIIANFYPSNNSYWTQSCMHLYEENYPNNYSGVEGIYFSASKDTLLYQEFVQIAIYEWDDDTTSETWASFSTNTLNPVFYNDYIFGDDSLNEQIVYHEFYDDGSGFPTAFTLQGNQRYLVCLESYSLGLRFGYDKDLDYTSNASYNLNLGPGKLGIDGSWYSGWASANAPSIGLQFTCNSSQTLYIDTCSRYNFNGTILDSTGTYTNTFTNSAGCDSIVTINFNYSPNYFFEIIDTNASICNYDFNGTILNSGGIYYDTLQGIYGCDSIIELFLDISPIENYISKELCGSSYDFNGTILTSPGYYQDTIQSVSGCDSIIYLDLLPSSIQNQTDFISSQMLFTSSPFIAQFTNTTPNLSDYNFTWDFGDSTIIQSNNGNVFHDFLYNGLYSVKLIAQGINTGCKDTMYKQDFIYCTGGFSCDNSSTIYVLDTLDINVSDIQFQNISPQTYLAVSDTFAQVSSLGCDSIVSTYRQLIYNPNYFTDTILTFDTLTTYDTLITQVFDSLTVYDTINIDIIDTTFISISVSDTLYIDITVTGMTSMDNTITVYPNPANDVVIIDNGNYSIINNYNLMIFNSLSQQVFFGQINTQQFQIPVSTLGAEGTYIIQILDSSNNIVETKYLILN